MRGIRKSGLLPRVATCESGASLLEVTLIMPLALVLFVGIAEFGRGLWAYHAADKSVRSAARYLARVPMTATVPPGLPDWAVQNATKLTLKGKIDPATEEEPLVAQWGDDGKFKLTHELESKILKVGASEYQAWIVRSKAEVEYAVPLLGLLSIPPLKYVVQHQERHIGE